MKKYFVLTSVLALTACAGGSGGGGGVSGGNGEFPGGNIEIPRIAGGLDGAGIGDMYIAQEKELMNAGVIEELSGSKTVYSSNGQQQTLNEITGITQQSGAPSRNASSMRGGSASVLTAKGSFYESLNDNQKGKVIDALFENMYYWANHSSDIITTTDDKAEQAVSLALQLAGFGKVDDIANFDKIQDFKDTSDDLSDRYDKNAKFNLADLAVYTTPNTIFKDGTYTQDKIKFNTNAKGKIISADYIQNAGYKSREITYHIERKNDENQFTMTDESSKVYKYYLDNIDEWQDPETGDPINYDPMHHYEGGEDGTENSIKVVSQKESTISELKELFIEEIELLKKEGWFDRIHNNGTDKSQEEVTEELYNHAIEMVNALSDDNKRDLHRETESDSYQIDFKTFGKDNGLLFSDFGYLRAISESGKTDGGYKFIYGGLENPDKNNADHLVSADSINKNKPSVFSGQIVGHVVRNDRSDDKFLDSTATLTFDNGKETLEASFANSNWYDIKAIKQNGSNSIMFTDNTNGKLEDMYKFAGHMVNVGDSYKVDGFIGTNYLFNANSGDTTGQQTGVFDTRYYGNGNNPSEVVGVVSYVEGDPDVGMEPESYKNDDLIFEAAFGGVKQHNNQSK